MKVLIFLVIALCASALAISEKEPVAEAETHNTDKRQSDEGTYSNIQQLYRMVRKQEQVAPVEESQDDDKGLRNGTTSLQPSTEDQGDKVDRPPREQPPKQPSSSTAAPEKAENENKKSEHDSSHKQVNVQVVPSSQAQNTEEISVEHRGLSLEDRRNSHIPPPQDGKSYTPEEFTSLIVAGFAVTPIPDFDGGYGLPNSGLINSQVTSPRPVTSFASTPLFYNQNQVTSTLSPPIHPLRDQSLRIDQARLLGHYRQSLETLPPPKNGRFYTPEEYDRLVAAGYPVTAVPVNAHSFGVPGQPSRFDGQEYRPGQVFSLNPRELLELQPERKAPSAGGQVLQQLYLNPQQDHKQNLQQIYYLEPQQQSGRQVPPSHTVIARPHFNFNGGEASVGAALSVSDTGASSSISNDGFDQELLALLGQPQVRAESHAQAYSQASVQSTTARSPQYQQVDRYVSKPSKKSSKFRSKVHVSFPQQQQQEQQQQPTEPPQQYLIETTNIQQRQQPQSQYRSTPQPQRLAQALRYVPITQAQDQPEFDYERPETQGLKIVPAPKLQQLRPQQLSYRVQAQQYQQEAQPKQYRIVELPQQLQQQLQQLRPQPIRQELRLPSSSIERPVAYLKRYLDLEKQRSVKIYDPVADNAPQQQAQLYGEQFILRPVYRNNEQQRPRYEIPAKGERAEPTKQPHSAIYVSKNVPAPRKQRPQLAPRDQADIELEQHGRNLDDQRSHLPPPKNNKAYTPEEFAALVAAGYSVTPVPVSAASLEAAQSRISEETVTAQPKRRLTQRRRNQYLPVRDDAP